MEPPRNHPLIIAAAAGVLIFSVLGVVVVNDVRHSAAARRDEAAAVPKRDALDAGFESAVKPRPATEACADCGVIEAIRLVKVEAATNARSVTDHLLGKNVAYTTLYRVALKMDDGSVRTLSLPEAPVYAVGDAVRVQDGALARRG